MSFVDYIDAQILYIAAAIVIGVLAIIGLLHGLYLVSHLLRVVVSHLLKQARATWCELMCWRQIFAPKEKTGGHEIKIATSGFRPVRLRGEAKELVSAVEQLVRTTPAQSARVRTAPDLIFAIRLSDGEHVFEFLAGGTVLRDPVTRNVWQFAQGRALLQSLLPYRKLPVA